MKQFFFQPKRKFQPSGASTPINVFNPAYELLTINNTKKSRSQFNVNDDVSDPWKRFPIESYGKS